MAIDVLLTMLYLLVIGGCVWLFTRHRDRPSMQAILMVPVSFALYALTRRVVTFTGGNGAALLDDRFLVFFWAWLVAWVGWSARITWRLQTGRTVIGPDGQRWGRRAAAASSSTCQPPIWAKTAWCRTRSCGGGTSVVAERAALWHTQSWLSTACSSPSQMAGASR